MYRQPSHAGLASLVAAQGRGGDSTLVHMTPGEVANLRQLAHSMGVEMPTNPHTGLPEASWLSSFLTSLTGGKGLSGFLTNVGNTIVNNPQLTSAVVGTTYGLIKGDLRKGLEMGMKAYAGSSLLGGIASTLQGAKGTPPIAGGTAQPSTGGPFGEIEPAESAATPGGASRPATLPTVQTTTQQPSQQGGILSNLTNKFQTDPIFKAIALYAINKAEKKGQASAFPQPTPYQYRNVQYTKGTLNPRWREPGQPYFIGGGYTDYGMTTKYPGYNENPAAQPQPTAGPPQPTEPPPYQPPNQPYAMAAGGMVPVDEGTIPAPNYSYPMANIKSAGYSVASQRPRSAELLGGYDTAVDPFTGEEIKSQSNFADGGTVEEQNNLADYFQKLRPFAPALSDYYRSDAAKSGIGSLTGGNNSTVPAGNDLKPYAPELADYYRSLLQPPGTSRPPIDLTEYFSGPEGGKKTIKTFTTPVPPPPTTTTPAPTEPPPPQTTKFPMCPPGTSFSAVNYFAGLDPCVPDSPPCPSGLVRNDKGECVEGSSTTPAPTPSKTGFCPEGFTFDPSRFEIGADPCVPNPCPDGLVRNENGDCVEEPPVKTTSTTKAPTTPAPSKTDLCPAGFTFDPDRFEIGADPCVPDPCPSGLVRNEKGDCVEAPATSSTTPSPSQTDTCPAGFTFDPNRFEIGLDPCIPDPCPSGLVRNEKGECVEGPVKTSSTTKEPGSTPATSDLCPAGFTFDPDRFEVGLDPCIPVSTTTPEPSITKNGSTTPAPTPSRTDICPAGFTFDPSRFEIGLDPCIPVSTTTPEPSPSQTGAPSSTRPAETTPEPTEPPVTTTPEPQRTPDPNDPSDLSNQFKYLFRTCPGGGTAWVWENCDGTPNLANLNNLIDIQVKIGNKMVSGAGVLNAVLSAYDTYRNVAAGKEGYSAMSGYGLGVSLARLGLTNGWGAFAGAGPAGLAIAAVAALGASLVKDHEMGDVALRNYWDAMSKGRGLGMAPPQELAEGFINFFRTTKNNFAGSEAYGRRGNEDFLYDMTKLINTAVDNGMIKPGATSDDIYKRVVAPWMSTLGSGPADEEARLVQDFMMTDLIHNFMLGRPISNAQVKGDTGYKIVSDKPVYKGVVPENMKDLVGTPWKPLPTGGGGGNMGTGTSGPIMENAAGGAIMAKRKKKRKYATGGIAGLDAGAINAADGYNFGFAQGGISALPEYKAGGRLLRGPGDGMSDDIPAVIRGKTVQRAALADGEFVIPADVVSHLGNGSTDAGAKKLYKMMEQIRRARTGKTKQAPRVNTDKFLPRV